MGLNLLDYFPYDTPREGQTQSLSVLQDTVDNWEVAVIRSPVGSGKSGMAVAAQLGFHAAGRGCTVLVPNNILRAQYLEEFDHMETVKAQHEYVVGAKSQWHGRVRIPGYEMTLKKFRNQYGFFPRGNQYSADLSACRKKFSPCVLNFYTYIAQKLYKDILIIDEAHQMLEMLKDMHAKTLWQHIHKFPSNMSSVGDLMEWAEKNSHRDNVPELLQELSRVHPASVIEYARALYRNEWADCIKIKPFSVRDKPPILWPKKIKRIVLMSATINQKDLEFMGLGDRVIKWIDTPSPIPKEQRPIIPMRVANMSATQQQDSMPKLVNTLKQLADKHEGQSGFVHIPYTAATKLQQLLGDDSRFIFHSKADKNDKFAEFLKSKGKVFVGSGMTEGIDLKGDLAGWQLIAKVPWPSLGDSVNRWIAEHDPDYYALLTAQELLQASGRVCRGPEDYGVTYVFDSSWDTWYTRCKKFLPLWFTEAIKDTV